MQRLRNNALAKLLIALLVAGALFVINLYLSNQYLTTNMARIFSGVISATLALPLFIAGTFTAIKRQSALWVAANIAFIALIVGWTIWISLILYAFRDFQLTLPPY